MSTVECNLSIRHKIGCSIWNFFCKVKIALILLIILAVTSILGTLFSNIYNSWWYILLLFFLSMNLIICTIDRFPPLWKILVSPVLLVSDAFIKESLKEHEELNNIYSKKKLEKILKKNRFNVYKTQKGLYGEKGKAARLGPTITHLSIIIIFIGAIISSIFGYKGFVEVFEGRTINNFFCETTKSYKNLGFEVHLNKFSIEYHPRRIFLKFKDIRKNIVNKYEVFINQEFLLDKNEYRIKVEDFDLNFEFEDGPLINERFPGRNNAAVELSLYRDGKLLKRGWFFWAFPEFQEFKDLGILVRLDNYLPPEIKDYKSELSIIENGNVVLTKTVEINDPLRYKGIMFYQNTYREPVNNGLSVYVSGLQIVNDPGVWIVYFGCGLMIIGVILSFYIYHERIWINMESEADNKILIGGISNKNHFVFNGKFKKILDQIKS